MWRKTTIWLLALMSILTVSVPAISLYTIDQYSLDTVEEVIEGGNINTIRSGDYVDIIQYQSSSEINRFYNTWNKIYVGSDKYDDSIKALEYPVAHFNHSTYTVGINNTYHILMDNYKVFANQKATMLFHSLNLTSHSMTNDDGYMFNTTMPHGSVGLYIPIKSGDGRFVSATDLDNNLYYVALNNQLKLDILANWDSQVYIYYEGLNLSDLTWEISIERLDVSKGIDQTYTFSPMQITIVMLFTVLLISSIFTLFATDTIDIKIDRQTRYLKRRRR